MYCIKLKKNHKHRSVYILTTQDSHSLKSFTVLVIEQFVENSEATSRVKD